MADKTEKKKCALGKKIVLWVIGVVCVTAVLLVILFVGKTAPRKVSDFASMEENVAVMNVVSKLSNSLFTKDNKIAVQSTVELTPAEVNAIFATAIRAYQLKHSGAYDAVLFGELKDGKVRLQGSQPFLGSLAINARGSVIPGIADKKLTLKFSELRAGRLPLSGALAETVADKLIAEIAAMPEYQNAMEVIISLKINGNGNLELTFIPAKIAVLLALLMQR